MLKFFIGGFFLLLTTVLSAQRPTRIYDFPEYNAGMDEIKNFVRFDGKAYYLASSGHSYNPDLYETDGTSVTQISTGIPLQYLGSNQDFALYQSNDGLHILKGGVLSTISSQAGAGSSFLYFAQQGSNSGVVNLWYSDGTNAGTKMFFEDVSPTGYEVTGNGIYFEPLNSKALHHYSYQTGHSLVGQFTGASQFIAFIGHTTEMVFFNFDGIIYGANTSPFQITTGYGDRNSSFFYGNKLYYYADGKLFVTHGVSGDPILIDGTKGGYPVGTSGGKFILTTGVIDLATDKFTQVNFPFGSILPPEPSQNYFYALQDSACHTRIYKYDVADLSRTFVTDLPGHPDRLSPSAVTVNGKTLFDFNERWHGLELFVTDGTKAGTKLLYDANESKIPITLTSWMRARDQYYFYGNADANYVDLWSMDSATNVVHIVRSFCSPTGSAAIFKNDLYFDDNGVVLRSATNSGDASVVYTPATNNHPFHIVAGPDAMFVGESEYETDEYVHGTTDGIHFDSIGRYSLRMAAVQGATLFQLEQGSDSVYLNKSQGISSPLVRVSGVSINSFSSTIRPFGNDGLLILNDPYAGGELLYYFDGNDVSDVTATLRVNGFVYTNNYAQYNDTLYFRMVNSQGVCQYYRFVAGMSPPQLMMQTAPDSRSSLIGVSSSALYHLQGLDIMKFVFATGENIKIPGAGTDVYRQVTKSFRVGADFLYVDDRQNLTLVNTTTDNAAIVAFANDSAVLAAGGSIYYADAYAGGLWKIDTILGTRDESKPELGIYPNPSSSKFYVSPGEFAVALFAADGRKVADFPSANAFDISNLPAGLYIAKLSDNKGLIYRRKIIKE